MDSLDAPLGPDDDPFDVFDGPDLLADPLSEDEIDRITIEHRVANDNGHRTSLEDILAVYDLTVDDLEREPSEIDRLTMMFNAPSHSTEEGTKEQT